MLWACPGTTSAGGYGWGTDNFCYNHAEEVEFYSEVMWAGGSGELGDLMKQSDVFRFEL